MTTLPPRPQMLAQYCAAVIAGCSVLIVEHKERAADWLTVATRVHRLAAMEGVTLSLYPLDAVHADAARERKPIAWWTAMMAGALVHLTIDPLADEIAHTAEWLARKSPGFGWINTKEAT